MVECNQHTANNRPTLWLMLMVMMISWPRQCHAAASCPSRCHCLPHETEPHHWKIICRWSHLSDTSLPFVAFPLAATRSLTIECRRDARKLSTFRDEMFAVFPELRHLELRGCVPRTPKLPPKLFHGVPQLMSLHVNGMSDGGAIEFDDLSFAALPNLEKLTITDCGVVRLPSRAFCELSKVTMLNLSQNAIEALENIGLDGENKCGQQWVLVDFSHNKLERVAPYSLRHLSTVRSLHLSHNQLRSIAVGVFDGTPQMSELWLDANIIHEINSLPTEIRRFNVANNRLTMFPPVLQSSEQLVALNISHNQIDALLQPQIMSHKLQEMDLSYNAFRELPPTLFANKSVLERVFAQHNELIALQPGTFVSNTAITELNLADNQLTAIGGLQLRGIKSLRQLNLERNELLELDDSIFDELQSLEVLLLQKNQLNKLPIGLSNAKRLQTLDVSWNSVANIKKFLLAKMPALRTLNLAHNNLRVVERYVFEDIQNLEKLDLSWNSITTISGNSFDRCTSLAALQLQHNSLYSLKDVVDELSNLHVLDVSHNRIDVFDIAQLPDKLHLLSATDNQMRNITNSQPHRLQQQALSHVDLARNQLSALRHEVWPIAVQTVNVSYNAIATLENGTFAKATRLAALDISHNRLRELRRDAVVLRTDNTDAQQTNAPVPPQHNTQIWIAGNPFDCSCHMEWLHDVHNDQHGLIAVVDMDRVLCKHLINKQSYYLRAIERAELLCAYNSICTHACTCCAFDACVCKNVCPDECDCYSDNQMRTNIVKCTALATNSANRPTPPLDPRMLPTYATMIYLDGIHLPHITANTFFGRYTLRELYLNASRVARIDVRAFSSLNKLTVLDLADNQLNEWRGDELYKTEHIQVLRLNGNRLRTLRPSAFAQLSDALHTLTLHDNNFELMPDAVISLSPQLTSLTLAGNPWRCDCHDRFVVQRWLQLPVNKLKVRDLNDVVCVENLERHANDSGALALLPATDGVNVRVKFSTFHNELNRSLCRPLQSGDKDAQPITDGHGSVAHNDSSFAQVPWSSMFLMAIGAALLLLCVVFVVTLIVWRHRSGGRDGRWTSKQRKSPASLNSTATATTTTPILLAHDVLITYSRADVRDVKEIAARLENEAPYYQVCLLHEHTPLVSTHLHMVADEQIRLMERSQCNILFLSPRFLANEWQQVQTKVMLNCARDNKKHLIIITSEDLDVNSTRFEEPLDKCLRTNKRIRRDDPRFWELLLEALPSARAMTDGGSDQDEQYSYVYGTIRPSMVV